MIRGFKRWRSVLLAIGMTLAIVLTNCASQTTQTTSNQPAPGSAPAAGASTLVYGLVGDPSTLEPGNVTDGYAVSVQEQIYDRLLDTKPGTTELVPSLATEWSASDDELTWTFKLRPGVKFHDGTDFNAEAVRFNVNRWWDPNDPTGFRNAGKTYESWLNLFGGFKGDAASLVSDVRVVDNYTIQFQLKQPFAAFPAAIASGYFGFASPTAMQQAGAEYGTANGGAIGTGAFIFKEWQIGDRVVLEKNPNYWQAGLPKSERLVFRPIKEATARLSELRAGTIDFTENLSPEQRQEIQGDDNLQELQRPSFNTGYLALNPAYEPLSKQEVRQAIAMAIDKKQLVQAFYGDLATTDAYFTPPALKEYQAPGLQDYPHDPERAKKLLADAGYANGFDLEIWYAPINGQAFPNPKPTAENWAADLQAIGIRVTLNTKDWAAYLADRVKPPGYQAFMLGWTGDYGDPDNFFYPHFGPGGTADIGNWKDDRLFQLLDDARQASDKTERATLYAQVDKILHEQALRLPIVHSSPLLAQRTNLAGWVPSPLGSESFATVEKRS